jgi:hypothetical protein
MKKKEKKNTVKNILPTSNNYTMSKSDVVKRLKETIQDVEKGEDTLKAIYIIFTEYGHRVRILREGD